LLANVQKISGLCERQVTKPVTKSGKGLPPVGVAIQDYLTEQDVHKMARLATSERNRLLVLLLFYSALRIREALSLTPSNLLTEESHIKLIQSKTKQSHEVGLPRWLTNKLASYIKNSRILNKELIFPISPVTSWQLVRSYGHKIGKKHVYPHLFRHSRAIDLARKLGKETEVSRHLGHVSDATVKTYFRFLSEGQVADKVVELDEKQR